MFDDLDRRLLPRQESKISSLMIWTNDTVCQEAVALDESLTGIALLVRNGGAIQVGQEVRLTRGECEVLAIVRHVHSQKDGKYRLGLEWGAAEIEPMSRLLLASRS